MLIVNKLYKSGKPLNELAKNGIYVNKIYRNGEVVFQNVTVTKVTAITLDNLVWVTNIPASGGAATKENCTYSVTAYYSDGTTVDVTSEATITGSQVIPNTDIEEVHSAGTLTLTASYSGFTAIGNVTVYQEAAESSDFSKKPLTFIVTSGGTIVWRKADSSAQNLSISYSINNGTWTTITASSTTGIAINVSAGDKIQFKGDNTAYGTSSSSYSTFSGSTAGFEVEGNIMSLINSTNFITAATLESGFTFISLFNTCTGLTSAENLILPAMTLKSSCYENMFRNCSSLTTAPELPATTLANNCYSGMFWNCSKLKTAPVLPASETLRGCYWFMFSNCYSLTTVPAILATTLKSYSCSGMLGYCSKLNYIKCLATEIETNSTGNWVSGVASTGTFVKNPKMTSWETGTSGIPTGWTVIDI